MSEKSPLSHIPGEMRRASIGSFPLSPGTMAGHKLVAKLYSHFRYHELRGTTIEEVFGHIDPDPPTLHLPKGHIQVANPEKINKKVWCIFLDTAFHDWHAVDPISTIRTLIQLNAKSDETNFSARLSGKRSKIIFGQPTPSLLRAFTLEDKFPFMNNQLYQWLIPQMANEIRKAHENDFQDPWSNHLQALVLLWNANFPDQPFIPESD